MGFKNKLCLASLPIPGFKIGARECSCLRHTGHSGPHRAQGFLEWEGDTPTYYTDTITGNRILV